MAFEVVVNIYDYYDSIINTCIIPVMGSSGVNNDTFSFTTDLSCHPDTFDYGHHYSFYIHCPSCDSSCISDTVYYYVPRLSNTFQVSESEVLIYPNPTNDVLNIKCTSNGEKQLNIYRTDGTLSVKKKLDTELTQINLNDFNTGVYFVILLNESGEILQTSKVIKIE